MDSSRDFLNHLKFVTYLWWIMMALAVIASLAMFMIVALLADGVGELEFYMFLHTPFCLFWASAVGLFAAVDWRNRGVTSRGRKALRASVVAFIASWALVYLTGRFGYVEFWFLIAYLAIGVWFFLFVVVGLRILKARRGLRAP